MIITTIEELRMAAPAHALDSIDGLTGFIDNSEHDFLEDKLGGELYEALCEYYNKGEMERTTVDDDQATPWNKLLLMAQRIVAFDALGSASGMQVVSVNNSGINQLSADDYKAADKDAVETYRQTCAKEAHKALNRLLTTLEQWCKEEGTTDSTDDTEETERSEIVALWQKSRYYYKSTASLIPTAMTLQDYMNIYENREKFIMLLPELMFIQEEIIATAIGEEFLAWLIAQSLTSHLSPLTANIIHRLRKIMAALLIGRTSVIKYTKEQKIQAHDDGVRMMDVACTYIRNHQQDILDALGEDNAHIFESSPLYVAPAGNHGDCPHDSSEAENGGTVPCDCHCSKEQNQPACWTPPLM